MLPDAQHLHAFMAVAVAGSVTGAAARLGRTQSAVSVQLRQFEELLGARLFVRQARGMRLTEAGERLVPAVRHALDALEALPATLRAPLDGQLRVALPDDYGTGPIQQVLSAFARRHPEVELVITCALSSDPRGGLLRDEVDLAVAACPDVPLDATLLAEEATVWAAQADFRPGDHPVLPVALFDRQCWWRDAASDALDRAGRAWRVAVTSESTASIKGAISAGLAVGALAASALEPDMRTLGPAEGLPPLPLSYLVCLRRPAATASAVVALEGALREAFLPERFG
jgi:DNA-binding transcriptional LysR family regulator